MVTVFGYSFPLPPALNFLDPVFVSFLLTGLAWALIALLAYVLLTYLLRAFTRRLPGELEDIILGIIRRPVILLIITFGIIDTIEILPVPESLVTALERIFSTILVLVILYIIWRVIKDILVYYGKDWARKTESKIDDNLVPILNVFGPVFILVVGVLTILPLWGVDISSVLVGAGVIGLVIGLALQDSLSNLFSGMSLVIEAPYRIGDLIVLPDGQICEVENFGLRSTQLYSLDQHSTVYMPNKELANSQIINITKPTVERRSSIEISIGLNIDLTRAQEILTRIASSCPGVLVDNMGMKIILVQERLDEIELRGKETATDPLLYPRLVDEIGRYEQALIKLEKERLFNEQLSDFEHHLESIAQAVNIYEERGFTEEELSDLAENYVNPANLSYQALIERANSWLNDPDPWASADEHNFLHRLWSTRNERLAGRWQDLKENLSHPRDSMELRLDDYARALIKWLTNDYKLLPDTWKNPQVVFKGFDGDKAVLQLWFYVDNIRLEHDGRLQRITTDIARHIQEKFSSEAKWI